jgi:hypothetical protein
MTYVFFREAVFYLLDLDDDLEARCSAEIIEGTTRVETLDGRLVWEP